MYKEESTKEEVLSRAVEIAEMLSKISPGYEWEASCSDTPRHINPDEHIEGEEVIEQYLPYVRATTDSIDSMVLLGKRIQSLGITEELNSAFIFGSFPESYSCYKKYFDLSECDIGRIENLARATDRIGHHSGKTESACR